METFEELSKKFDEDMYEVIDRALLFTFQLSNIDYDKIKTSLSAVFFVKALEQDGWTVVPTSFLEDRR